MLTDALYSEAFKFLRNRSVLFWGFLFAPLVALTIGLAGELYFNPGARVPGLILPMDVSRELLNGVAGAAQPLTQLFCLIGAAALFSGEYRWETWRLLTPRNSRFNLLLAKAGVYAAASAVTVVAIGLAAVLSGLAGAAAHGWPLRWSAPALGPYIASLLGLAALSWAQLLQVGAIAAAAAVVTRSTVPAVIAPIVIGVAQAVVQGQLGAGAMHPRLQDLLALPGLAGDQLRAAMLNPGWYGQMGGKSAVAIESLASLAIWILGGFALATAVFRRQDLSRE